MSLKYKVGDSFLLRMTIDSVDEDCGDYCMGKEADGTWLSEEAIDKLSAKAAAYAAKTHPDAPDGWGPKHGEKVLVEVTFDRIDNDGDLWVYLADNSHRCFAPSTPIIGPAPKRSRFSVGDVVVYSETMEMFRVSYVSIYGSEPSYKLTDAEGGMTVAPESDLLTIDEARDILEGK